MIRRTQRKSFLAWGMFILLTMTILIASSGVSLSQAVQSEPSEIYTTSDDDNHHAQFRLELGSSRFYLTSLEEGESWYVNLTAVFEGTFYIYMFDNRPKQNFLGAEETIVNPKIKDVAVLYNETPTDVFSPDLNRTVKNIQLNYTAKATKLHYLEIILVENGPDTFELDSTNEIQSYFIPFIDGFPVYLTLSVFATSLIVLTKK